jgi:uncharacterized protein (DUF58 family)
VFGTGSARGDLDRSRNRLAAIGPASGRFDERVARTGPARWRPTLALARAVVVGAALLLLAVLLRRPDLVVLAAPLLLGAGIGLARRPFAGPSIRMRVPPDALLEGGHATVEVSVDAPDGVDIAVVELAVPGGIELTSRAVAIPVERSAEVGFRLRALRWGRRQTGPAQVRATAGYGMLSWPPVRTETATLTIWPLREDFGGSDVVPRAEGLVGGHVSRRPGEGGDLAGIRPFQPGDRLRRINWRVTGRTGRMHVTATYSDRDTEVLLVLDSEQDLGRAPESSLDVGVRAAAAVAEFYLRTGDRVGLVDLGNLQRRVPPRNGRNHLVRLLDVLLDARPNREQRGLASAAEVATFGAPHALVVLLSPLVTANAQAAVATIAHSGRSVVAVDTLPPDLHPDPRSSWTPLAFRIWRLRRAADLDRLGELGVPVVTWSGPGSLDAVLRDVGRAARAAKAVR